MGEPRWTKGKWEQWNSSTSGSGRRAHHKVTTTIRAADGTVICTLAERDDAWVNAHGRLLKNSPRLYEALEGFLSVFWPTAEEGHTGFVDRLGMQFYRETGIWPPFKSEPAEIARPTNTDEAQKAWRKWLDAKRDAAAAVAGAALAAARGEGA